MSDYHRLISRVVNLSELEYGLIGEYSRAHMILTGGFSASLRAIIQEWYMMREVLQNLPSEARMHLKGGIPRSQPDILPEDLSLECSGRKIEYPATYL